jgi:hypothetical protein
MRLSALGQPCPDTLPGLSAGVHRGSTAPELCLDGSKYKCLRCMTVAPIRDGANGLIRSNDPNLDLNWSYAGLQ